MISPYKGKFRVSQEFKCVLHSGLDLVGVDKNLYAIFDGKIEVAGYNDPNGFGTYVRQKITSGKHKGCVCYYGHMSKVNVKVGETVKKGTLLGLEGNTGHSFGNHCHLEVRRTTEHSTYEDVSVITGIPNKSGATLYKADGKEPEDKQAATGKVSYYKACNINHTSLVDALNSIKVSSRYSNRAKIAKANKVKLYIGRANQNTKLLNLLKKGRLVRI